jgi:hypothetical protein
MSFGRRTTAPTPPMARQAAETPRTRRGGYWLGLLVYIAATALTMALMPFISNFKANGAEIGTLLVAGAIGLLNLAPVAAVILLLVDLALRTLGWRRPWIYALVCGLVVFGFHFALVLAGGRTSPIFLMYVALWPAAAGGWVMGLFRR